MPGVMEAWPLQGLASQPSCCLPTNFCLSWFPSEAVLAPCVVELQHSAASSSRDLPMLSCGVICMQLKLQCQAAEPWLPNLCRQHFLSCQMPKWQLLLLNCELDQNACSPKHQPWHHSAIAAGGGCMSGTHTCMPIWYRLSADLGAFVGLAHEPSLGGSPQQSPGPSVCPFPMPAQYEEAKESKVQTVATLRNSIKSVSAYLYV